MEKTWFVKDSDPYFYGLGIRRATEGSPFTDEKNPARAFTYSLFLWGAGQSYSGLRMKSALFQIFMLLFLIGIVLSLLYGKELMTLMLESGVSPADFLLSVELLLFAALIFWTYNAIDAYRAASKARRVPFRGIQNRALPMLSSLLIPGWGQFMNGQPLKGTLLACFSVLGIFSIVTVPTVLFYWPSLEASRASSIIEAIFAVTVFYAPLIPVICLLSSYDALRVSIDEIKKELLLDRIVLGINRLRRKGWMGSIVPLLKSTFMLALLLGALVIIKNHYPFPVNYFSSHLADAQAWFYKQGMTLVPELIDKLLS